MTWNWASVLSLLLRVHVCVRVSKGFNCPVGIVVVAVKQVNRLLCFDCFWLFFVLLFEFVLVSFAFVVASCAQALLRLRLKGQGRKRKNFYLGPGIKRLQLKLTSFQGLIRN